MIKNCLNCKYEPIWGKIVGGGEYKRKCGECRFPFSKMKLPGCASRVYKEPVSWFIENDSCSVCWCDVWETKDEEN